MRYVAGGCLPDSKEQFDDWLEETELSISSDQLLAGIAAAVYVLHSHGFVHGDLKPSNILIEPTGPILCDFGLSKHMDSTTTCTAVGVTPDWAAPEMKEAPFVSTQASDIYSLGLIATRVFGVTGDPWAGCLNPNPRARPTANVLMRRLAHSGALRVAQWEVDGEPYSDVDNAVLEREHLCATSGLVVVSTGVVNVNTMQGARYAENGAVEFLPVVRQASRHEPVLYPPSWRPFVDGNYCLVPLDSSEDEWKLACQAFSATMSADRYRVQGIQRIQNRYLWERYCYQKRMMRSPNEQTLFHGTRGNDPICVYGGTDGFDFRLSRVGYYGRGAYFASRALYSHSYSHVSGQVHSMIVATVLCGEMYTATALDSTLVRPPLKSSSTTDRYDSVSDGDMFVVYNNHQAYPLFLLSYTNRL